MILNIANQEISKFSGDFVTPHNFMLRQKGIPELTGSVLAARNNSAHISSWLCAHRDYTAAKSGDAISAMRLIGELVPTEMLRIARGRWPGAVFLFGSAYEAGGLNLIPAALAWHLCHYAGGDIAFLTQKNRACHTGSSAAHRIAFPALFEGEVEKGRHYVLIDDVAVLGGTLAQMANLVSGQGGKVVGVAVMVNATRAEQLWPTSRQITMLQNKYQNDLEAIISIRTEALTRPEAEYLAGFRNLESIRNRIAGARDEGGARGDASAISKETTPAVGMRASVIDTLIDAADAVEGDPDCEECPDEDDSDAESEGTEFYLGASSS